MTKIKVLVAEDSAVVRMLLVHLLETDPAIEVVGQVSDGQAAVAFVQATTPDAVLMDIHMPRMNGFEATRRIMETQPVPIIVCSATADTRDTVVAFQAMEAGAIACIEKPLGSAWGDDQAKAAHLVQTVKLMSEVKVVRRTAAAGGSAKARTVPLPAPSVAARVKAVGIGASTGGPAVLQTLLAGLPEGFAAPILVVQHLAPGFLPGLVAWLTASTRLAVEIARDGVYPLPGHVYLAPDDCHMGVSAGGAIVLSRASKESHVRPAVSFLFRSLAQVYGPRVIGVLLTGMGRDGADELRNMRDLGATTIAQDEASSVVHGMPGVAIALGAASLVLASGQIADTLVALVGLHTTAARS
ncbi:MAG TPA: chemotaxis-specific protein-glutamate methyltransferase CheB [Ramlibacter sp.]|nr:chemotaxis-specific protein-glutamate methyltransferase CheB [Ramlibacter sp.]